MMPLIRRDEQVSTICRVGRRGSSRDQLSSAASTAASASSCWATARRMISLMRSSEGSGHRRQAPVRGGSLMFP